MTTYYPCDCGTEILRVEHTETMVPNAATIELSRSESFVFAIYRYKNDGKYKFAKRLKIALRLIFSGKIFADQITLTKPEANKMADFIRGC